MNHRLRVGQAVIPAFRDEAGQETHRDGTHRIIRLMPVCAAGKARYQIQCRTSGAQRLVGEDEIKAAFPSIGAMSP